jgi:phosphoadenosine phosphosulfate reductase
MDAIEQAIGRHSKIALQLSGGRDSMACLYLLRPYWDRLTVYWCNTGAPFPETVEWMAAVRAMVPNFVEIEGRNSDVLAQFGMPSDIVPSSHTPIGLLATRRYGIVLQDRYSCCARTMMVPTHERMLADGITLIIRGQRADDVVKADTKSGDVHDGIELLYPIEHWSADDVMAFLRKVDAPIPRFYEMLNSAPDCMTCSAWWEHGTSKYLKRYHHPVYLEVQRRLDIINEAVGESIANFNKEVT